MIGLIRINTLNIEYLGFNEKGFIFQTKAFGIKVKNYNLFFPFKITEDKKYLVVSRNFDSKLDLVIEKGTKKKYEIPKVVSYLGNSLFGTKKGFYDLEKNKKYFDQSLALFYYKNKYYFYRTIEHRLFVNLNEISSFRLWRSPCDHKFKFRYIDLSGKIHGDSYLKDKERFLNSIDFDRLKRFYEIVKPKYIYERGFFLGSNRRKIRINDFDQLKKNIILIYERLNLPSYYPDKKNNNLSSKSMTHFSLDIDFEITKKEIEKLINILKEFGLTFKYYFESSTKGHIHITFSLPEEITEKEYVSLAKKILDKLYKEKIYADPISMKPTYPLFVPYCPIFIK